MKFKLFVSDFDGTLLRSDFRLSKKLKETISLYIKDGGIFTISSGRMYCSLQYYLGDLGLENQDIYLITYNGSLIKHVKNGKILYFNYIKNKKAYELAKFALSKGLYFHTYVNDRVILPGESSYIKEYLGKGQLKAHDILKVNNVADFLSKTGHDVHKCIFSVDKEPQKIVEDLRNNFGDDTVFYLSSDNFIECVNATAGKGNALKFLAKYLNIPLENTISVGDNDNDICMLESAGISVAMSNGSELAKKTAKYICPSNDEDGVVDVLNAAMTNFKNLYGLKKVQ